MKLPIGIQSFEEIRTEGYVYIDKTAHIFRLVTSGKYFFLSRPRRFGKSLLLSTLNALYEGRQTLFSGLWIEKHWNWNDPNPVIHLKFSSQGVRTIGTEAAIYNMLGEEAARLGVELKSKGYDQQFKELIQKASASKKVVVLIDEYDKPIIDFLDELPVAVENRQVLKNFYSVLKDCDPYIELLFMTGVSRFSKTSIFSDLNNLVNLTMHPLAVDLLGITSDELDLYFSDALNDIAQIMAVSSNELKKNVQLWYNGYSWNGKNKVYNPFSLLNFFYAKDFDNYWFETGTPTFLVKKMRETHLYNVGQIKVSDSVLDSYDLENLNPITILFQTGYLTIQQKYRQGVYLVDYPNQEVKVALEERLLNAFSFDNFGSGKVKALNLVEALEQEDIPLFIDIINATFASIPAPLWQKDNEAFYHALIHLVCSLMGAYIQSEVHSANGRLDSKVELEDTIYILEFKLDKSPEAALKQIKDKGYFKPYLNLPKKRIGVGINFSRESKTVDNWLVEKF